MKGPTGVLLIMGLEIQSLEMSSSLFWVSLICFASLLRSALCVVSLINNVSYSVTHKSRDGVHINELLKAKFVFALVLHWSLVVDSLDLSLRPEFHAMVKMGKNAKKRPSDGDSN